MDFYYQPTLATEVTPIAFNYNEVHRFKIGVGYLTHFFLSKYKNGYDQYYGQSLMYGTYMQVEVFFDYIFNNTFKLRFSPLRHICSHISGDILGDENLYDKGKEEFRFPKANNPLKKIQDILDNYPDPKYTLSDKLWTYLQNYADKHKAKGNGFGFGLVDLNGISRTLSARYYKDGSEILIPQENGMNPRRLTPRECARLMGYPDEYIINKVSDVQAYRQCGNSVVVPLITAVSKQIVQTMLTE